MKVAKIIAYCLIIALFAWINYAMYQSNVVQKQEERLFKPTEEKLKEYIPNTTVKKPDFSLTEKAVFEGQSKKDSEPKTIPQQTVSANDREQEATTQYTNSAINIDKMEVANDLENVLIAAGLVDIQSVNADIKVDLKYSCTHNFLQQDVYGDLEKAYLQKEVAEMLSKAQTFLNETHPNYQLIIYDAVRPHSVQKQMWEVVKGTAQQRYVASPFGTGSLHNYGASVDLSIVNDNGEALDMGSAFDHFGNESQPRYEQNLLAQGKISETQINNRKLLRTVMKKAGFTGIQSEWWHYNAFSKTEIKKKFKRID